MLSLMQDRILLVPSFSGDLLKAHTNTQIASRTTDRAVHDCSCVDIGQRAKQVANALVEFGVQQAERIGTLAWNGYQCLEMYFGVFGMRAVFHTINPRLFNEQIEFIANHVEGQYLFLDLSFALLVEQLMPSLRTVMAFIPLCKSSHLPLIKVPDLICSEALIA